MAEYGGLLLGLEGVANREYKSYNPMQALSIEGDSQLVIKQLTGEYECKHKNLKPLCAKAKKLIKKFEEEGTIVTLQHIHGYLSRREPSRWLPREYSHWHGVADGRLGSAHPENSGS